MINEDIEYINLKEREETIEILKPKLKYLFLSEKYDEFNKKIDEALKRYILPKHKYDRYSSYTPYTQQVTKTYNLPNYVNASFVFYPKEYNYICCMNPKKEYFSEFEDFLFYSNTQLIITLNEINNKEEETLNEFDYLKNNKNYIKIKEYSIPELLIDEIYIYKKGTKYERNIQRIRFLKWEDFSVPNISEFLIFYNYYLKILLNYPSDFNKYSLITIHCLAGVGRTGTFVSFDIINKILKEKEINTKNEILNIIFDVLCKIKLNRRGMVQTKEQINWIINYFLKLYVK